MIQPLPFVEKCLFSLVFGCALNIQSDDNYLNIIRFGTTGRLPVPE